VPCGFSSSVGRYICGPSLTLHAGSRAPDRTPSCACHPGGSRRCLMGSESWFRAGAVFDHRPGSSVDSATDALFSSSHTIFVRSDRNSQPSVFNKQTKRAVSNQPQTWTVLTRILFLVCASMAPDSHL
jgi:hypothetical protein